MISQTILNEMIEQHQLWLEDPATGKQFDLRNERINELDFQEGNLSKAFILGCDIKECCLKNVNFTEAQIGFTAISKCKMQNINFQQASLSSVRFMNNEIGSSSFYGSTNLGGVFYKNNLESSNFKSDEENEEGIPILTTIINHCALDGNNFSLSDFENTSLNEENFVKFKENNFQNCNFKNCDLKGLFFSECDLTGSSIENTIFDECNFTKSKLEALNFDTCSLANCLGDNKNIITVQAHLFTCVIAGTKMYVDTLVKDQEEWLESPDSVIVADLLEAFPDSGYTEEELTNWWSIWKPIFERIIKSY